MITLAEAQAVTGGQWLVQPLSPETPLQGGCFDTRAAGDKEVFFALPGEHADGHDYLSVLPGTSVKMAVVARQVEILEFGGAVLRVDDVLRALADMAGSVLRKHDPAVVAITGSYGKTTTKEVAAHVLAAKFNVLRTPGSLNNEIGVPITLLDLDGSQQVAVLEFSARQSGDIEFLGRIAPPHIAVLLAVGQAHIGVFGSQEDIYRAKGEIFAHLRPGGLAVINAEDSRLEALAAGHRQVSFGCGVGTFHAEDVRPDSEGRQVFTGVAGESRLSFHAGMPGPHGLYAMLAAWAVARELGVEDSHVAARAGMHPEQKGRAVSMRGPGGSVVIDDSYNASPETVVNLIDTLAMIDARERILVLGHLSELEEGLEHSVAQIAAALRPPLDELWVHAPHAPGFFDQLRAAAGSGVSVREFDSLTRLIAALRERDVPGVVLGIKGGRSAHVERALQGLLGVEVACGLSHCGLLQNCADCPQLTAP